MTDLQTAVAPPVSQEPPTMAVTAPGEFPLPLRSLLDAGVHFGHQTKRWNPKMRPFIYGARNGIHIIDLDQTTRLFKRAYDFIVDATGRGGTVLFVGTKRQAQDIVIEEARRSGMYFVTNRWLGGTLTNFRTIKGGLDRLRTLERMKEDGTYEQLLKKEVVKLEKERERLEKYLGGLKGMGLAARRGVRDRSAPGVDRDQRGAQAQRPARRHHRHELRSRRDRLRDPWQRRRDPIDPSHHGPHRGRVHRGLAAPQGRGRGRRPRRARRRRARRP